MIYQTLVNIQKGVIKASITEGEFYRGGHPFPFRLDIESKISYRIYKEKRFYNSIGAAKTYFAKNYYKGEWEKEIREFNPG